MSPNPAFPKSVRWKKSVPLLPTVVLGLLLGCARGETSEGDGYLDLRDLPERCEQVATCGGLVGVDCGSEVDGPYYYVRRETGRIIQTCGGACMRPVPEEGLCGECPPAEWTCEN